MGVLENKWQTIVVTGECQGTVVWVKFNREHRLNAFDTTMVLSGLPSRKSSKVVQYEEFRQSLEMAAVEVGVNVVVVSGMGQYFSSGNDLNNFTKVSPSSSCK